MKKILLVTPIFSEGCTGLFILDALNSLGYSVSIWDPRVSKVPPTGNFNASLVWTHDIFDVNLLKGKKVLVYLDCPLWQQNDPDKNFEHATAPYDYIYTLHKVGDNPLFESKNLPYKVKTKKLRHFWAPMGCSKDIHHQIELTEEEKAFYGSKIAFIGTLRDPERGNFIGRFKELMPLKIWGNGWNRLKNPSGWMGKPVYFQEFNKVCNASKIILVEHYAKSGPSDKDFEIPACGGALMISDDVPSVREIFPMCPIYHNFEEAIDIVKYYLEHELERQALVKEMQEIAYKFSYKNQLKKILEDLK